MLITVILSRWMKRIQGWSMLAILILALANPVLAQTPAANPDPTTGISWTGGMGIRETTAQIMARAQSSANRASIPGGTFFNGRVTASPNPPIPASPGLGPAVLAPAAPLPNVAQTIGISFDGPNHDVNPCGTPPDTMGAVGPTQFIIAVNCKIVSYNKTTGAADGVLNTDPATFFTSVKSVSFVSDPHIRYDRISGRWFIVIIDVAFPDNRILLAVSNSATITAQTTWTFFFFQDSLAGQSNCLGDYPTPGIDANAIYLGINDFCGSSLGTASYLRSDGFVIQKSSVLGAGPIHVTAFPTIGNLSGGLFTPQGVDNPDPAATEGYFIGNDLANVGRLDLRRVSNPGGATPTISSTITIPTALHSLPLTQPHKNNANGSFGELDASDNRLFAAYFRNGSLWTSQDSAVNVSGGVCASNGVSGDRDAVFWYELAGIPSGSAPSVRQFGIICDTVSSVGPAFYSYGTIMVSGQGHAAIGYTIAGNANFTTPGFSGRLSSDPLSTQSGVNVIVAGTHPYNPSYDGGSVFGRRWGDYSYTSLDPCDDMTLWTIQEYASSDNIYGERVAQLLAPPPPALNALQSVHAERSNIDLALSATAANGSGFYDTPASLTDACRKRLQVSISGGVTVNSVTFTDPTHLALNISTLGVTPGPVNVTVTNPDGQSITGTAILTVLPNFVEYLPVLLK